METLKICKHSNGYGYCFLHEEYCSESPCEKEELIEYAPVQRGRWVYNGDDFIPYCNQCQSLQDAPKNFCPNCGADMREAGHETN